MDGNIEGRNDEDTEDSDNEKLLIFKQCFYPKRTLTSGDLKNNAYVLFSNVNVYCNMLHV